MTITPTEKNKIITHIRNKNKLGGVKILYENNKGTLRECLEAVDKIKNELECNIGTITWFEYPKHVPTEKRGLWVLCYFGPNCPIDTCYYWGMLKKFTNDKKPTHFAYLNEPEPTQD